MKISFFRTGITQKRPTGDKTVDKALEEIRDGKYQEEIERLRQSTDKSVRRVLKKDLGYFTFSGTFKTREVNSLLQHSGFICIDLDDLDLTGEDTPPDPQRVSKVKNQLKQDVHIYAMFLSPSGNGLKLLFKIDPDLHLASFQGIAKYLKDKYALEADPSGKDVSRACFVSYDPDLHRYSNADKFTRVITSDVHVDTDTGEVLDRHTGSRDELPPDIRKSLDRAEWVAEQIVDQGKDLTQDYESWRDIGMALSVFGEAGRQIFHDVSQFHPEYRRSDCNAKFDNYIRTSRFTSPAAFFKIAKDNGFKTRKKKVVPAGNAVGANGLITAGWTYKTPDGIEVTDEIRQFTAQYGLIEYKNAIWYAEHSVQKKEITYEWKSNYIIKPLFLILSNTDPKRILEIRTSRSLLENCLLPP